MLDDSEDSSAPFMSESLKKAGVPFLTKWRPLFLFSNFWIIIGYPFVHYKHLRISFFPYTVCHVLFLSSFVIWKTQLYDLIYPNEKNAYFYFIVISYITSTFCLFRTILTDPGYLPFFYPATSDRRQFSSDEFKTGCAFSAEQRDWARQQTKPHRAAFSESAGYYVLRGDHLCNWMTTWIGLRNHRYFLLFIASCSIYLDTIFISVVILIYYHMKLHSIYFYAFALCGSGFFGFLITLQVFEQSFLVSKNLLFKEALKQQVPFYDRGCTNNWAEICGPKKYMLCWPIPCVPLPQTVDGFNYKEYVGPSSEKPSEQTITSHKTDNGNDNDLFANTGGIGGERTNWPSSLL